MARTPKFKVKATAADKEARKLNNRAKSFARKLARKI